jgi:serine/threonine protein kinase
MATADDSIRPAALAVGAVFQGGYEILNELGSGTSGVVHRARQLSSGQEVAIKVLRARRGSTAADSVGSAERFRREMREHRALSSQHRALIDSGETDDGVPTPSSATCRGDVDHARQRNR